MPWPLSASPCSYSATQQDNTGQNGKKGMIWTGKIINLQIWKRPLIFFFGSVSVQDSNTSKYELFNRSNSCGLYRNLTKIRLQFTLTTFQSEANLLTWPINLCGFGKMEANQSPEVYQMT